MALSCPRCNSCYMYMLAWRCAINNTVSGLYSSWFKLKFKTRLPVPWLARVDNGRLYKSVSGYDRQVLAGVTGPSRFAVNENSIGTTSIRLAFSFVFSTNYHHYVAIWRNVFSTSEMWTEEAWRESYWVDSVYITCLILEHDFKIVCTRFIRYVYF